MSLAKAEHGPHPTEEFSQGSSLEYLEHQVPARVEVLAREVQSSFRQCYRSKMVAQVAATRLGGHIRKDDIGLSAG